MNRAVVLFAFAALSFDAARRVGYDF